MNKRDDGYSDDATYDLRQHPQRHHDLSLPAAPDFRSLSEFIKKPLHIQIPGFLVKNGETSEVFSSGKKKRMDYAHVEATCRFCYFYHSVLHDAVEDRSFRAQGQSEINDDSIMKWLLRQEYE